jgi:monoamine oxidase
VDPQHKHRSFNAQGSEMNLDYDVIVIGGGIAGLTAARDLTPAGFRVAVLEARDRLGGRVYYRAFRGTDQKVELGGAWINPDHEPNVKREVLRYGIPTSPTPSLESNYLYTGNKVRAGAVPVPALEYVGIMRLVLRLLRGAYRIDVARPRDLQGLAALDIPFEQLLEQAKLGRATYDLASAWIAFAIGAPPSEISALQVMSFVAGFKNSVWTTYRALVTAFTNGTASLVDALASDSGANVFFNSVVTRLEQDANEVRITTASGRVFRAGGVVFATPINTWRHVDFSPAINEQKQEATRDGHVGRAAKIYLLLEGEGPSLSAFRWERQPSFCCALGRYHVIEEGTIAVTFSCGESRVDPSDLSAVREQAQLLLPGQKIIAADAHDWVGDLFSRGTYVAFRPGQLSRLHSHLQVPEGRIVFAGSDIAMRYPATIDGAIESGTTAAAHIQRILRSGVR